MAYYKKGWGKLRKSSDYVAWHSFFQSRRFFIEGRAYECRFPADKLDLLAVLKYDLNSMKITWEIPDKLDVYTYVHIEW